MVIPSEMGNNFGNRGPSNWKSWAMSEAIVLAPKIPNTLPSNFHPVAVQEFGYGTLSTLGRARTCDPVI